jgi:predicted ester cyclase
MHASIMRLTVSGGSSVETKIRRWSGRVKARGSSMLGVSYNPRTLLIHGGTVQITDYERVWIEGLNRGDASVADDVFASDGIIHINGSPDPNLSVAGFTQMISGMLAAFPDLRFTIEAQFVDGDKVATRWSAEGTTVGLLELFPRRDVVCASTG